MAIAYQLRARRWGASLALALAVIAGGCVEPRPGDDEPDAAAGVDVRPDRPANDVAGTDARSDGTANDVADAAIADTNDVAMPDGPTVMIDAPVAPSCAASEHACDGRCMSNTSPDSCGTRCTPCALVTNAMPTCESATCGFRCNPDTLRCNAGKDACERIAWSFEGSVEGWISNSATDRADNGMLVPSADRAHQGSSALKAILAVVDAPRPSFRLAYWPCGRAPYTRDGPEALNVRNKTIRFWVYIDSANAPPTGHECGAGGYGGPLPFGYNEPRTPIPANTWTEVVSRYPEEPASAATFLGIDCRFNFVPNWSGAIYVDQVRIE